MNFTKEWLKRHDLTPAQAAKKLGMSESSIEKYSADPDKLRLVVKYAMKYLTGKWRDEK